jgi:hypothetical protein
VWQNCPVKVGAGGFFHPDAVLYSKLQEAFPGVTVAAELNNPIDID